MELEGGLERQYGTRMGKAEFNFRDCCMVGRRKRKVEEAKM